MHDRPAGLAHHVESLIGMLESADAVFAERDVEALLSTILQAARAAAGRERDAALRRLGRALHAEGLDEVGEALLIAACHGPLDAGGDPAPVAEAIVSFAEVTLPVCCAYFLIMAGASGDEEAAAEATHALRPLEDRFPQAGFEIMAFTWTAATLESLARRRRDVADELRGSVFVLPPLYALAPFLPAAMTLLRLLDPSLAAARRPEDSPPAGRRAGHGPQDAQGHGRGASRHRRDDQQQRGPKGQ